MIVSSYCDFFAVLRNRRARTACRPALRTGVTPSHCSTRTFGRRAYGSRGAKCRTASKQFQMPIVEFDFGLSCTGHLAFWEQSRAGEALLRLRANYVWPRARPNAIGFNRSRAFCSALNRAASNDTRRVLILFKRKRISQCRAIISISGTTFTLKIPRGRYYPILKQPAKKPLKILLISCRRGQTL
jgi:hypothetical protein